MSAARRHPPCDAEIEQALEALGRSPFALAASTLAATREQVSVAPAVPPSPGVERSDHVVDAGTHPVRVRVHRPASASGPLPCVYSMHGGGFVMGSYRMDDARLDRWCARFGCVGVSVDYRLAPESPYPDPLDDCDTGLRWVVDHAAELGVDRARIGIAGVSAGGGLAAGLALLARDRGEPMIAFQLLMYPMVDDRQATASSRWLDPPVWDRAANEFGWRAYLGHRYGTGDVPPYAAPARADDLAALPATFIAVGTVDPFLDEDVELARRLAHAGVPTDLRVYAGAPHGFDRLVPGSRLAALATADADAWLGARLAAG